MDKKRYISQLLILCFSAFLGHNFVPHHHHFENIKTATDTECAVDYHLDDDHPIHCHAFNNVDFIKYSLAENQQLVRVVVSRMVPVSGFKLEQPGSLEFMQYTNLKIPDKTPRYLGAISMRAPPISAT